MLSIPLRKRVSSSHEFRVSCDLENRHIFVRIIFPYQSIDTNLIPNTIHSWTCRDNWWDGKHLLCCIVAFIIYPYTYFGILFGLTGSKLFHHAADVKKVRPSKDKQKITCTHRRNCEVVHGYHWFSYHIQYSIN